MITQGDHMDLDGKKGKNPFSVPDQYFESFEHRVISQIQQEGEPKDAVKTPLIQMVKPYLYLAASFLLFFIGGRFVLSNFNTSSDNAQLSDNNLSFDQEVDLIYSEVNDFTITDYLLENDLQEDSQNQ